MVVTIRKGKKVSVRSLVYIIHGLVALLTQSSPFYTTPILLDYYYYHFDYITII